MTLGLEVTAEALGREVVVGGVTEPKVEDCCSRRPASPEETSMAVCCEGMGSIGEV